MEASSQDNNFELKNSEDRGAGIVTKYSISQGEIVMSEVKEKITNVNHEHASQIGEIEFVTPIDFMALVNHSCRPNCGIKLNETGAHDYVAMQDIVPGEDITFDYAMQNYDVEHFPIKCLCGVKDCRGKIGGWKDLSIDKKQQYKGFVAPYLLELDTKNNT